jgi:two-component system LytT family sensor kinase
MPKSAAQIVFNKRLYRNVAFWVLYFLIQVFFLLQANVNAFFITLLKIIILDLLSLALAAYLHNLYILPKYFNEKKYLKYSISLVILLCFFAYLRSILSTTLQLHNETGSFLTQIIAIFFILILFTLSLYTYQWFDSYNQRRDFENKSLQMELNILRAQINPHFLFNTLNNIYSLSLKKSDHTPEAILRLSDIMRYMLYDSNLSQVNLNKELAYIRNYLDLERLRVRNNELIKYNISQDNNELKIAPLLLIPFVENCFKHGVLNDENCPLIINIVIKDNLLIFESQNKIKLQKEIEKADGGIGLNNIKRRLELLYKNNYELKMENKNEIFHTYLKLKL